MNTRNGAEKEKALAHCKENLDRIIELSMELAETNCYYMGVSDAVTISAFFRYADALLSSLGAGPIGYFRGFNLNEMLDGSDGGYWDFREDAFEFTLECFSSGCWEMELIDEEEQKERESFVKKLSEDYGYEADEYTLWYGFFCLPKKATRETREQKELWKGIFSCLSNVEHYQCKDGESVLLILDETEADNLSYLGGVVLLSELYALLGKD